MVDKVVPNVLVDGGSGLNILPEHTMKRLGLNLTGPSPFIINIANQSSAMPLGMIKNCRISTEGEEYVVIFHVIKMHSNKDIFSILLGRPWLRMSDAIVDWGGARPSITYGLKDNRDKVSIGSLGGWMRKEIASFSEDEGDDKEDDKIDEALVVVVHSGGHGRIIDSGSDGLGPCFYHYGNNGECAQCLREYPESEFDVMVTFHHACLSEDILSLNSEEYYLLEPCEVLTEEEWILGGLTPWVDSKEKSDVTLVHVDGTHDEEPIVKAARLKEPLHFKTTSTRIVVGQDVKDYPKMPADWYRNKDEQAHLTEVD